MPEFIKNTGIQSILQSILDKESNQSSKQKTKERAQPKTGKIDIDYNVFYDAFFKYQTKPKLSSHADVYFEGKEYKVDIKERKPRVLSAKICDGLGMGPPENVLVPLLG